MKKQEKRLHYLLKLNGNLQLVVELFLMDTNIVEATMWTMWLGAFTPILRLGLKDQTN